MTRSGKIRALTGVEWARKAPAQAIASMQANWDLPTDALVAMPVTTTLHALRWNDKTKDLSALGVTFGFDARARLHWFALSSTDGEMRDLQYIPATHGTPGVLFESDMVRERRPGNADGRIRVLLGLAESARLSFCSDGKEIWERRWDKGVETARLVQDPLADGLVDVATLVGVAQYPFAQSVPGADSVKKLRELLEEQFSIRDCEFVIEPHPLGV